MKSYITYFKIKYKKDIPEFYYIQAELNLDNALIKYSKAMEKSSNSLKPLEYSKFIVTMCLNNKGVPVGLTTTEECKMLRDTPIGVQECPCKFSLNYTISYLNENINYEIKEF